MPDAEKAAALRTPDRRASGALVFRPPKTDPGALDARLDLDLAARDRRLAVRLPERALPAGRSAARGSGVGDRFLGSTAFQHLRALAALGPRVAGTPEAGADARVPRSELEKLGLSVEEQRVAGPPGPDGAPQELVNLESVIPGASPRSSCWWRPTTRAPSTLPLRRRQRRRVGAGAAARARARDLDPLAALHDLDRVARPRGRSRRPHRRAAVAGSSVWRASCCRRQPGARSSGGRVRARLRRRSAHRARSRLAPGPPRGVLGGRRRLGRTDASGRATASSPPRQPSRVPRRRDFAASSWSRSALRRRRASGNLPTARTPPEHCSPQSLAAVGG